MVLLHGQDAVTYYQCSNNDTSWIIMFFIHVVLVPRAFFSVEVGGKFEERPRPMYNDEGRKLLPARRSKKCRQINNNMFVSLFLLFKPLPPWPTQPSNCIASLILRLLLRHQNFDCCSSHQCQMSNDQLHPTTLRSFQMVS